MPEWSPFRKCTKKNASGEYAGVYIFNNCSSGAVNVAMVTETDCESAQAEQRGGGGERTTD
jgi:hypothetical protein